MLPCFPSCEKIWVYVCYPDIKTGKIVDLSYFAPVQKVVTSFGVQFLLSIIIIVFVLFIRFILIKSIFNKTALKNDKTPKKSNYYIPGIVSIILLFIIWLPHLSAFFTLFSILGTGLVVVLKEVLLNIAGWFYIVIRKPFEVGNRITIDQISGDVIDIRLIEFSMIEISPISAGGQSTGRIIRVPNSMLFVNPLMNSSKDFALWWNEILVKVSIDSNWEKAASMLETLSQKYLDHIYKTDARLKYAERKYAIKYNKIDPKVYVSFENKAIHLTLRHLSEPKKMRDINDQLWRVILDEFRKEKDIVLI